MMTNDGTSPQAQQFRGISNQSAQRLLRQRVEEAYTRQQAAPATQMSKTQARSVSSGSARSFKSVVRGIRGRAVS